jgi:pyruvate,water dikinase
MAQGRSFAIPAEMPDLPGTEGWRDMYPSYMVFSKDNPKRVEFESSQLWFMDALHNPYPLTPLETYSPDMWRLTLPQSNNRIYMVPPSRGLNMRVLNGYIYISPFPVVDPEEIQKRAQIFEKRAGHYYQNWDEIFERWKKRAAKIVVDMESVQFNDLPEMEPESTITGGRGYGESYTLLKEYNRLWDIHYLAAQYHFELLNLAYGADAAYIHTMHELFPGITDNAIGKTVAGFDSMLFRPPEELQKLAQMAMDSGLAEAILACERWEEVPDKIGTTEEGKRWLETFEAARDPWFEMSCGIGWYYWEPTWNQNLDVPLANIKRYIETLKAGKSITRPLEQVIEERERTIAEYRALITSDEHRAVFDRLSHVAVKVAPYAEDHMWYWSNHEHAIFYRKMRELGQIFVNHNIIKEQEDIFYLNRYEIPELLYDLCINWAIGAPAVSSYHWPDKIPRRKEIMEIFREWQAPPALGPAPEVMSDPFALAFFGLTTERINDWLDAKEVKPGDIKELTGFAASAGVAEGPAKVCRTIEEISALKVGDILVAACTSPTWAPAFQSIAACVTDIGGTFSHASIVAREYGMPAVVGTGYATQGIKTGDKIRVDGDNGTVTIIERAS